MAEFIAKIHLGAVSIRWTSFDSRSITRPAENFDNELLLSSKIWEWNNINTRIDFLKRKTHV